MTAAEVFERCALCLKERRLLRSHILPELLWKRLYDEREHWAVSVNTGFPTTRRIRKGFRERLLCEECEGTFQRLETVFGGVWFDPDVLPDEVADGQRAIELSELPAHTMKLFHLSIFWRAAVARMPDFNNMRLGPRAEHARKLLLTADAGGELDFPVVGVVVTLPGTRTVAKRLLSTPTSIKLGGSIRLGSAVYAGCSWYVITSRRAPEWVASLGLQPDGRMTLPIADLEEVQSMDLVRSRARGHGLPLGSRRG